QRTTFQKPKESQGIQRLQITGDRSAPDPAVTLWTLYTLHLVSLPARASHPPSVGKQTSFQLRELHSADVSISIPTPPPRPSQSLQSRMSTSIPDVTQQQQPLAPSHLPPTPRFKSFSSSCLHSPTTELQTYCDASPTDLAATPTWQDAHRPSSRFVFSISPPRTSSCLGNQSPQEYRPLCGPRARGRQGAPLGATNKDDDDEDVSRKARWIIITTAVSLFVMSVLLVGIMLRLAPVIDDLAGIFDKTAYSCLPRATAC
ncbi:unnamed protein product, partial [Ixodes persulcatus]